jgi:hypothetical protein
MALPPSDLNRAVQQELGLAPDSAWQPMTGGQVNHLWKVAGAQGCYVVKLYGAAAGNPLFPNDAETEFRTLRHLQAHVGGMNAAPLAPRPLAKFEGEFGTAIAYVHQAAEVWTDDLASAARCLRQVHQTPPPDDLRVLDISPDAMMVKTHAILEACRSAQAGDLEKHLDHQPEVKHWKRAKPGLLHGDPVPANILIAGDKITLIDWQCPGLGDPIYDLAIFLSPSMQITYGCGPLSPAQINDFLTAYGDEDTAQRYRDQAWFFHMQMAAYALWTREQGRKIPGDLVQAELDAAQQARADR